MRGVFSNCILNDKLTMNNILDNQGYILAVIEFGMTTKW